MSFLEWCRMLVDEQAIVEPNSSTRISGQLILDLIVKTDGEMTLGQLKDETGLSYSELNLELKYLTLADLVESNFSLKDSESNPVLVYRLKS